MATAAIDSGAQGVTNLNLTRIASILARQTRAELDAFVSVAIALMDEVDGDPDKEGECSEDEVSRCTDMGRPVFADGPGCDIADAGENAWIEWQTMRGSQKRGPNVTQAHEDDEDDDPAGQYDEDAFTADWTPRDGPGCPIADSDYGVDDVAHDPDDGMEREQLPNDVPMLATYDLEGHYLGIGNLQSSFLTNGSEVRSADSGEMLRSNSQTVDRRPGSPV